MNRRYLRAPALFGAQTTTARGLEASSRRGGYREHFTRQRSACRNPPNVQLETCEKHTSSLLDGGRRGQVAEAIHPPLESRGFLALLCKYHAASKPKPPEMRISSPPPPQHSLRSNSDSPHRGLRLIGDTNSDSFSQEAGAATMPIYRAEVRSDTHGRRTRDVRATSEWGTNVGYQPTIDAPIPLFPAKETGTGA